VNISTQTPRGVRRIALTLLAALLLAPAAQARLDPTTGASVAGQPVASEVRDGFDWADAGIGAGVAAGIAVLAGAAARAGHRRRHPSSPHEAEGVVSKLQTAREGS
jgi:hypothetical protein